MAEIRQRDVQAPSAPSDRPGRRGADAMAAASKNLDMIRVRDIGTLYQDFWGLVTSLQDPKV